MPEQPPSGPAASPNNSAPGGWPRLVARCYVRECDGDPGRMVEMMMRDLWRNHPEWPSTFSPCFNPDCTGSGRGGGLCAGCVETCLEAVIGGGLAAAMHDSIVRARAVARQIRESAASL